MRNAIKVPIPIVHIVGLILVYCTVLKLKDTVNTDISYFRFGIVSRLWAESTRTVIGMDSTLSIHVPLAHFQINHIIVIFYSP